MSGTAYDTRFIRFLVLFNIEEDYFECHEVMEELWLEEGRDRFYQGLLQVAVGLHHWRGGNIGGAVKLFSAALDKLAGYGELVMGLAVGTLRRDTAAALAPLRQWVDKPEGNHPAFRALRIIIEDEALAAAARELAEMQHDSRSGDADGGA